MKKIMKSRIFIFILTAIMFTSIGVYATTTYKASDVIYNASDGTSMNVNDALNNLYKNQTKISGNLYYLGNCSNAEYKSSGKGTFDVSKIEGYEKFTVDNFISADGLYLYGYVEYPNRPFSSSTVVKKYDASTGILTITLPSTYTVLSDSYGGNHYMNAGGLKVYLYTGTINNLN